MQTTSTTRRSKRRQQILTPSRRVAPDAASWSGDAILIRDTELDDLWGEEQDGWERNVPSKTAFYEAFQRKNTTPNFPRTRKTVIDTYRIGDTVMISTTERLPSIAVIVSMWEIFPTEPLAIDAESDDEDNGINKMRIKVHWFLRPTELAPIGTKRKHLEVRII
jgi:origin recognition complex subunit 1